MKIVTAQQMSHLESKAYRDGASEADFMEEAGSGIALLVHDYVEIHNVDRQIIILCGRGNNAGDAYVAGSNLLHLEYEVTAYQPFPISECSNLCRQNHYRFLNDGGKVKEITSAEEITFPRSGVIIDGIFGTGFHGRVEEPIASIIQRANISQLPIVAADIPSGLDGTTGTVVGPAIIATLTAFLGLPKTGFFLREGWNHVGRPVYIDYGLPQEYIEDFETNLQMLSPDMMRPLMPPLIRNRHKYQAGHVVGLAGSPKMPGAAMLSSLTALRSGAGIVHLLHPANMQIELSASPYELIKIPYDPDNIEEIITLMNKASATFVGPGLGLTPAVRKLLREVLPRLEKPCVIDADALTIIAEEDLEFPKYTLLTPHIGEMKRLLKVSDITLDQSFLQQCQAYSQDNHLTLILKGGPSFIFHPDEPILVNPHGDPGMATAGSGDVLTGLLASLLAQGLTTHHAAALGVYLHGIAGEYAAEELTSYCMTASDIVNYLPEAFHPHNWTQ